MKNADIILIVENDKDDQETLEIVFKELGVVNPRLFFDEGMKLIEFLKNTQDVVFLILCDVNMPGKNGMEIREMLDSEIYLRKKSIPFVFYTTTAIIKEVNKAYEMTVQGYFEKPHSYEKIKAAIKAIVDYWSICIHPNNWR